MHDQRIGVDTNNADRGKVFDRFEGEVRIDRWRDRIGIGATEQQRVAISIRLRYRLRADPASGARQIFDNDGSS
jgi:hypothetical protein